MADTEVVERHVIEIAAQPFYLGHELSLWNFPAGAERQRGVHDDNNILHRLQISKIVTYWRSCDVYFNISTRHYALYDRQYFDALLESYAICETLPEKERQWMHHEILRTLHSFPAELTYYDEQTFSVKEKHP